MDLKGKVITILPMVTGEGKNGPWKKLEFVIETQDQYPKKVMFGIMGAKIDQNPVIIGQEIVVSFDAESREYNGKYYTNLNAWKITAAGSAPMQSDSQPIQHQQMNETPPVNVSFSGDNNTTDDLPF